MNQEIQTINDAYVVGKLKEKKINIKVGEDGKKMAVGHLIIVSDTKFGKNETRVSVMQNEYTKNGAENTLYKGLMTINQTYKSIAEVGEVEADLIKIEGSLSDETYYSANKDGFVEKTGVRGTFVNRLTTETEHCCKSNFEGLISKVVPVEKELEVEIIGIGYQGVAVPITVTIPEELVGAFQGRYMVGCTCALYVNIINSVSTKEVQTEVGFGEALGETITTTTTKRVVFGGGVPKYQGTAGALSMESVKQGLSIREVKLEAKKEKEINKNKNNGLSEGFAGVGAGGFTPPVGGFTPPVGGFTPPVGGFGGFPQ